MTVLMQWLLILSIALAAVGLSMKSDPATFTSPVIPARPTLPAPRW